MPAFEDPIRKQLAEARRAQIIDAAAQVFAEKGFHRATTREIASAAGVSEGTIYNYFDSKADLLIGIVAGLADMEHLGVELEEALQGDVKDFFIAMFRHRLGWIGQKGETILAVLPEMMVNPALRDRFYQQFVSHTTQLLEHYVQARVEMGQVRPLDVSLMVRAVQSMFMGLLMLRILGDEEVQSRWDEMADVLASLVFDGIGVEQEG